MHLNEHNSHQNAMISNTFTLNSSPWLELDCRFKTLGFDSALCLASNENPVMRKTDKETSALAYPDLIFYSTAQKRKSK